MRRSKLIYNTRFGKLYRMCETCYEVSFVYDDDYITSITRHTQQYVRNKFENND